ncbi:FAD-binding protein [Streptomyces sp. NPDC014864]|uniref:FAD-binding protein n=1 Tax=Streptomyces sp. NPDC014864 TaxID=3364924 RepID=UPI0036F90382
MTALSRDLPGDALITGPKATAPYAADRSGSRLDGRPLAVVHAANPGHVRTRLRHAHALRVPAVPRGAGTGLSGGANAGTGAVVLDLPRMKRILDLDPHDQVAVVEPGVITAELDRSAGEFGLRYAPGTASAAISTVGGNFATNAGGLRCAEYGVTRDAVLGLDVVLADGTPIRTGRRTVKTVLPLATGGTTAHVLAIAYALRPVLASMGPAHITPGWFVLDRHLEVCRTAAASSSRARRRHWTRSSTSSP